MNLAETVAAVRKSTQSAAKNTKTNISVHPLPHRQLSGARSLDGSFQSKR